MAINSKVPFGQTLRNIADNGSLRVSSTLTLRAPGCTVYNKTAKLPTQTLQIETGANITVNGKIAGKLEVGYLALCSPKVRPFWRGKRNSYTPSPAR
jgi:hypothetical protein